MDYQIANNSLTLCIDEFGAELTSIYDPSTKTEYLWNADPVYWKRHSPILFPFVGSLNNKCYKFKNKSYPMSQHGFARDMKFKLLKQSDHEIRLSLTASEATLSLFPFDFKLEVGYRLQGRTITVLWRVLNQEDDTMYFSIGGHPAFYCPLDPKDNQYDYFLFFDTKQTIRYQHIDENGLLIKKSPEEQNKLTLDQGILPINSHMFDYDALIIEDNQCHQVSIMTPERHPYITVSFEAPLFGLWSPAGKKAPFICIEPWYGRCDSQNFNGELMEREWVNALQPGQSFEASYTIEIH